MKTLTKHIAFALSVGLSLAGGCVRPTEERAERDLEVGKAEGHGLRLEVSDGLAAVRRLDAGELVLWSSAPAWQLTLDTEPSAPADWTVTLENVLPDVELSGPGAQVVLLEQKLPTRKKYRVSLPAGARTQLTLASPDRDDSSKWRFAVMSDVQEAIDDVHDIYQKVNQVPDVRFLLGAGDLTQQGSPEELERFKTELASLDVPYYTTLGNHELGDDGPAYQDWYGRASFSFVFRGVRFSMLDSAGASIDPLVFDWLDDWLAKGKSSVHIVAMHIPPIDPVGVRNGSFASRNEAAKLLTRLAKGSVDLTLYGHIHSYYSFDNAGIPAYISGGGGAIPERFDDVGRHFLVVDVDPEQGIDRVQMVEVD
ncbi:MAG: metallophosphoesterase [Myxococcales bacterium]|nr:metallophosphoesterase [Myxococcales bacterium]